MSAGRAAALPTTPVSGVGSNDDVVSGPDDENGFVAVKTGLGAMAPGTDPGVAAIVETGSEAGAGFAACGPASAGTAAVSTGFADANPGLAGFTSGFGGFADGNPGVTAGKSGAAGFVKGRSGAAGFVKGRSGAARLAPGNPPFDAGNPELAPGNPTLPAGNPGAKADPGPLGRGFWLLEIGGGVRVWGTGGAAAKGGATADAGFGGRPAP
jgi:hypothetical protein